MRIAIRADSSVNIGTGHVGRTLALAEELRNAGATVEYVCRDLPGQASFLAAERGFRIQLLPPKAAFSQEEDAAATIAFLPSAPDAVIVDHYELSQDWEVRIRSQKRCVIAIDDLANRPHHCDILIDPSLHLDPSQRYQGKVASNCQLLLGPAFALLRREFLDARGESAPREKLGKILVFFGGTDESNETLKAIKALRSLNLPGVMVDIVLGRTNPHHVEVKSALENFPSAQLHVQPGDFVKLMAESDLFLGAAGGTVWERACLGVPTICTATAENQVATAELLAGKSYHFYLGRSERVSVAEWEKAILLRAQSWEETHAAGQKSASLVDGRGAEKCAQAILQKFGSARA